MEGTYSRFRGFKLQRRLGYFLCEAKNWCLAHKNDNKINWSVIQEEARKAQLERENTNQASKSIKATNLLKSQAEIKYDYWKQRSKSKWEAYGDNNFILLQKRQNKKCRQ